MNRKELGALLNLKSEFIPTKRKNRSGKGLSPKIITIHNTSNKNPGANAKAHSNFVRKKGYHIFNGKKVMVSWHYTVDDKMVIKQLPINEVAYHAGTKANNNSISIEICMHQGINQAVADEKAAQLVAILCYDLKMPIKNIVTHKYWTKKNCPILLLKKWDEFINQVAFYLNEISEEAQLEAMNTKEVGLMCWDSEEDIV